ncbi:MAG: hypothetical protein RLZ98_24 [Pseudomonadota bacterium]|jgi:ATP-binding protein involved in chromosome partitioning
MATTESDILDALRRIRGPDLEGNIVELGLVSGVSITDGRVSLAITVPPERAAELEPLRQAAEKVVQELPGVTSALVVLTAERPQGQPGATSARRESPRVAAARQRAAAPPPTAQQQPRRPDAVAGVKHLIAVASGKGGVGKSTTAVNLALGFKAIGLKAGILDADVYGPSQPRLLGLSGRPEVIGGTKLKPMQAYGLKVMSMGFMVDEATPVIWRGPMVVQALNQMLREVAWADQGDLDVIVIDMPPGTGDVQLSIAQQVPLSGAVIVSTPQDLALIDARKGLNMFRKVDVPVLGIVENMSYFVCDDCGKRHEIFGHGGAEREAEKLGVPFLGGIPLDMEIRTRSDSGQPIVATNPESPHAAIYRDIAARTWAALEATEGTIRKPPTLAVAPASDVLKITFEDGETHDLTAEMLRVMSPSAEVQGHSPEQRVTVGGKRNVRIKGLRPVGNYAVRIVFDDGHDTGLYAWDYLARLGREKEVRWKGYLEELDRKGLKRD